MRDDPLDPWGGAWDGGHEPGAEGEGEEELAASALVSCPHCGAPVELLLDHGGGALQEYVEDCEVCCRPWSVRVEIDWNGRPSVTVATLDDA